MYQQLRKFINVVDELRDVGLQQHIRLPRIAMLGGQSAGKSSVLESIVGLDFLPRGSGVVTRRPLELRLNHASDKITPWAKFDEVPNKKFTNFAEVKQTIEFLTDKVCGKSKNIIDKPIVLTVYSHTCPDLTMIDLPGITRIPMAGSDQPDNIEQITRSMAHRYVSDSRTIILCVLPANADMTTSDGLQMARECDPKGIRTIGVITKIDIMDKGTNAKRMIEGKDVSLRLGFIGIKNRSQQDIIDRIPVKQAIEKEQLYFQCHPIYSTMQQDILGVHNLTTKLTKILFTHIKHSLPEIMKEIKGKIKESEDDLEDLGPPMPHDAPHKIQLLWNMITDVVHSYKNAISGRYDAKRVMNDPNGKFEFTGGSKIKMSFYTLYREFDQFEACNEYTNEHIQKAINMHEGDGLPGFPSVDVFIYLVTPQLEQLREPALDLVQDVFCQLEQLAQQIVQKNFQRFPSMIPEIMDIIMRVLIEERDKTRDIVEQQVDYEQNYLFTNDQDYKDNRADIVPQNNNPNGGPGGPGGPQGGMDQNGYNRNQNMPDPMRRGGNIYVNEMRVRINKYFQIVLRNVKDTIPKTIGYFLVRKSQEILQFELYNQINKNEALIEALGEPKNITERRKAVTEVLTTLKSSLKVLQRDPDISANTIGDSELEMILRQESMQQRQAKNQPNQPPGQQRRGPPPGHPGNQRMPSDMDEFKKRQMQAQGDPRRSNMPAQHRGGPPPQRGGNPLGGGNGNFQFQK